MLEKQKVFAVLTGKDFFVHFFLSIFGVTT